MSNKKPCIKGLAFAIGLTWLASLTGATETDLLGDKRNYLASAMGTIVCDGEIRGSAANISIELTKPQEKSVLISAAHILFEKETGRAFNSCQYRPQNKRFASSDIESISTINYKTSVVDKILQAENDIVFLTLSKRLQQPALELSKQSVNNKSQLTLIAYSAYLDRIILSDVCKPVKTLQPISKKLLLHDCKAQAGTSGGAIVDTGSGKIVAIHGGALVFDQTSLKGDSNDSIPPLERYQVPAEKLINQGRLVDSELITDLEAFTDARF